MRRAEAPTSFGDCFSGEKLLKQLPWEYYSALSSLGSEEVGMYFNYFGRKHPFNNLQS